MKITGKWGTCGWELYAWGHLAIEGGIASSISDASEVPWHEYRENITTVSIEEPVTFINGAAINHLFEGCVNLKRADLSKLNTSGVVSMNSVFENCELLRDIDMSEFDTSKTVTMRSMFKNCSSIEQLDLSGFDTSKVLDMGWMFADCESLRRLNTEGFNTSSVLDMERMFLNCGRLDSLSLNTFDMSSVEICDDMFTGTVLEEEIAAIRKIEEEEARKAKAEAEQEKHRQPKRNSFFARFTKAAETSETVNVTAEIKDEEAEEPAEETPFVPEVYGEEPEEMIEIDEIKEETEEIAEEPVVEETEAAASDEEETVEAEESAESAEPVESVESAGSSADMDGTGLLAKNSDGHAIYAGAPFFISPVEQIPPITYGERLRLRPPQVDRNNGDAVVLSVEISPNGVEQWVAFNPNMILPATGNGCYVRYRASNSFGSCVSDPVRIIIRKADFDISEVRWKGLELTTYDGKAKSVELVGLPEGLTAVYYGNTATDAGEYLASARWEYDERNYNCPPAAPDFVWRITKADYHMPNVRWSYDGAFEYDGTRKFVALEGLIPRITPIYKNNAATECGVYYATVELDYDHVNYNPPAQIMPVKWEIKKTACDMSSLRWKQSEFVYDGTAKTIELDGIPEGVTVHYSGNTATDCGTYTASASFEVEDVLNFNKPEPVSTSWTISKAVINTADFVWDNDEIAIYDGTVKTIALKNLSRDVNVRYYGNSAIEAGDYIAKAELSIADEVNYEFNGESLIEQQWRIDKADYDMSDVCWNYKGAFTYDGSVKKVELLNLPAGVRAEYTANTSSDAGIYNAEAALVFDEINYNRPSIAPCRWEIEKADIDVSGVYWQAQTDSTYDGSVKSVALAGLPELLRVEYEGNTSHLPGEFIAKANLSVTDPLNYNVPEINNCKWSVKKAFFSMEKIAWDYSGEFTYDGSIKAVRLLNVPEGFRVEYSDNEQSQSGTYTASARLIHDEDCYIIPECPKCTWTIRKADYDLSNVRWSYRDSVVYDGSVKEVVLENLPEGIIPTYIGNTGTEVGRYAAKVLLDVKDSYNYNVPGFAGISWSIEKANYDLSEVHWVAPEGLDYDGEVKTIELEGLPSSITAEYSGNKGVKVGNYCASVKLSYDTRNYYRPVIDDYEWSIEPGEYDFEDVRWDYVQPFKYDGEVKTVELTGYSYDVSVRYSMNKAVDAGLYEATAYFTLEDTVNYKQPEPMKLSWEIEKASFDMGNVRWSYDEPFTYSGSANTVKLYNLPEGVWADYEQNVAADSGSYEAKAIFGVNNHQNYVIPESRTLQWNIRKAELDMSSVHWDYRNDKVYTGNEHKVELVGLPRGIRPVYSGNTATEAGDYTASVKFVLDDDWNFVMPKIDDLKWTIEKADFDMSGVHWNYNEAFTYDGKAKTVELANLPAGLSAEYFGNTAESAGTYEARVRLTAEDTANFNSPVFNSCSWRILKADYDMSKAAWDYRKGSFIYDGSDKSVELINLPKGVTVSYVGNTESKAGDYLAEAYFTVDDPRNFNVPYVEKCRWGIAKQKYDMSAVEWDYSDAKTYNGRAHSVELVNLPEGVSASYYNNVATAAGNYIAAAKLLVDVDNYEIPTVPDCRWTVGKADPNVSSISWNYRDSFTYDGSQKSVELAGVPQGMSVTYSGNKAVGAGTYTAEAFITMDDSANFNTPVIEPVTWTIDKADYDMSRVSWSSNNTFTYDASKKKVELTGLPEGVKPSYKSNSASEAGSYVAEASLNYDEKNYNAPSVESYSWMILKADYDMSAVCWNYSESYIYDGSEKRIELIGLPAGIKPVYENASAVNAGSYTASVEFEFDEKNYNRPSFEKCTWVIDKADVDLSKIRWNYSAPFTYNGEEHSIALMNVEKRFALLNRLINNSEDDEPKIFGLPENMDVHYDGNTAVNAGVYTATVLVTPQNLDNYNIPEPVICKWEIKKAEPDMSQVEWDYENVYTYDGKEKKVNVFGLPEGVSVASYEGNSAVDVGTYIARVTFRVAADGNYNMPEERTLRWKIEKATLDMSDVRWDYTAPFAYDGNAKTVGLLGLPAEVSVTYINNSNSEPGTYVTKAVLSYDKSCYRVSEVGDLKWRIEE